MNASGQMETTLMMISMTTTVNSTAMTIDRRKHKSIIHETTVVR